MQRITTYLFVSLLASLPVIGQSIDSLIVASNKVYQNTQKHLVFPSQNNNFFFEIIHVKDSTFADFQIQLKKAQQKALLNDIGLTFKANVQYNFNGDLDEETNTFTNSRIRTELEWNIIKSGFLNNRNKSQQLENEIAILTTEKERQQRINWRRQFRLQYTYSINKELITLFKKKQDFLYDYFDILANLYAQSRVKRETFIRISQLIGTTQTELTYTQQFNLQLKDSVTTVLTTSKLPLVQISKLQFEKITQEQFNNSALQAKNVHLKNDWTNTISLSAYTNYNWLQTNINNRNFGSIGLRLKIPLRLSNNKAIIKATIARDNAINSDKITGTQNQFVTYYNAYREKIRDLKNQYQNWQVIEERKRVLQILKQELKTDKSGIEQLALQLIQFEILENTLRLKMQLYTALSHLYELDKTIATQPFVFEKIATKEVIVTAKSNYDMAFQIAFAKANNIDTIYISTSEKAIINKWKSAGFEVKLNMHQKNQITLNDWINNEYKNLKTNPYESFLISTQNSSDSYTKRTKN